jgi:hypothetical protein
MLNTDIAVVSQEVWPGPCVVVSNHYVDNVRLVAFPLLCVRLSDELPQASFSLHKQLANAVPRRVLKAFLSRVAQWVEHQAMNLTVTGSTPVNVKSWLVTNLAGAQASTNGQKGNGEWFGSVLQPPLQGRIGRCDS